MIRALLIPVLFICSCSSHDSGKKVEFPSKDGLTITADWYIVKEHAPVIVCFHQARSSRGEYIEVAPKLNALGYNVFAVDLRSGSEANDIVNETARRAKTMGKPVGYFDAEQDLLVAMDKAYERSKEPIILFGSSYSASFALKHSKNDPRVRAAIAFSPGEYFGDDYILKDSLNGFNKPAFVTSAKEESADVMKLLGRVNHGRVTQFIPKGDGTHGAKVLDGPDKKEYWAALEGFLKTIR